MKFFVYLCLAFFLAISYADEYCSKPNEHFTSCGSPCVATCTNRQFANCVAVCVQGCFCNDGYLRNENTGECVLPADC